jgi:phage terminase small subunit|tara:strand:+ start:459 stop:1076 length:618 start_codon:yes stop_codon:yes gene_type:complete
VTSVSLHHPEDLYVSSNINVWWLFAHLTIALYFILLYKSIMGLPKKLTDQQIKFAQLLVTNEGRKTPTECAIEAGYADGSARVRASELRNPRRFPLVVGYIGELREEYNKKYEVDYGRHIAELGKIRQSALDKGAWSAAVNAEVARGKAAGLYIEQKIIRTGKLEDLSAEELETRMKEIIEEYSPILEGESVSDLKAKVLNKAKE